MSSIQHPDTVDTAGEPRIEELSLPDLRTYRERLRAEEERVSYWRRVVHARLDLLEIGRTSGAPISFEHLVRVLGDTGTGAVRCALGRVHASDPLPELPDLAEVWSTAETPTDRAAALARLRVAEHQLTSYRAALLARIEQSTAALIGQYRVDPAAALTVLR